MQHIRDVYNLKNIFIFSHWIWWAAKNAKETLMFFFSIFGVKYDLNSFSWDSHSDSTEIIQTLRTRSVSHQCRTLHICRIHQSTDNHSLTVFTLIAVTLITVVLCILDICHHFLQMCVCLHDPFTNSERHNLPFIFLFHFFFPQDADIII